MSPTPRIRWADLLAPISDGELVEVRTRLGRMRVLETERVGHLVVAHGRHVLTGHPMSASATAETPVLAA